MYSQAHKANARNNDRILLGDQVAAQLGIVPFNQEGVGFPFKNFIFAVVITKELFGIKCAAVILLSLLHIVNNLMDTLFSALPDEFPTQIKARLTAYDRNDVDPVFYAD